jgi:hypothetical protein
MTLSVVASERNNYFSRPALSNKKVKRGLKPSLVDWDHVTKMEDYQKKITEAYGFSPGRSKIKLLELGKSDRDSDSRVNRLLKKAHLLSLRSIASLQRISKYASARRFLARLAAGPFEQPGIRVCQQSVKT